MYPVFCQVFWNPWLAEEAFDSRYPRSNASWRKPVKLREMSRYNFPIQLKRDIKTLIRLPHPDDVVCLVIGLEITIGKIKETASLQIWENRFYEREKSRRSSRNEYRIWCCFKIENASTGPKFKLLKLTKVLTLKWGQENWSWSSGFFSSLTTVNPFLIRPHADTTIR